MNQDLGEFRCATTTDLTVYTFTEVENTRPDNEPPGLITETVLSRVEGEGKSVVGIHGVTYETTSCMSVESDHEEECQVMGVPESLEALVTDLVVGSGVHQEHDQEHEMTGDTASLGVVNIKSPLGTNLCEAD